MTGMDRSFQEVFPGLKGDREVQGLLPLMDVRSIRYSRDKKSLLIFTRVKRLVPRTLLARIETLLDEQFLSDYQGSLRAKICAEYLLPDTESPDQSLLDLARKSIERALELKIPIAGESERATTCGAAGTVAMKNALLFMALKKDLELDLSPAKVGAARNTNAIGDIVYDALSEQQRRKG